ncbi:MAG: dephospho-CoA kinase [Clostridiales bacterium]|nr:dephospho-CoA kinase [Clostridiales bacterium]
MTKVIGLTGQIGSGKSLAASILAEMGAAVIDADELARQVVEPGQPAYNEISAAFGAEYILPQGGLDRKALAALIFSDEASRSRLNAITHPRIRKEAEQLIKVYRKKGRKLIVLEAALLIGSGFTDMLDEVWLITAPKEQIFIRLAKRDGLSKAETAARLKAQLPVEIQAAAVSRVIENNGSEQSLRAKLSALGRSLQEII